MTLAAGLLITPAWAADEDAPNRRPVKAIAPARIAVGDQGVVPLFVSRDWSVPLPDVTRAVLVLHGRLRDADVYYRSALTAQAAAGAFGTGGHHDRPAIPRRYRRGCLSPAGRHVAMDAGRDGKVATRRTWPAPASSFAALDAILARLADRTPVSRICAQVVVAGHSGGGQVVQRYAIAGNGEAALTAVQGVGVRYVVANPSSYAYFDRRPPGARRSPPPAQASTTGNTAWTQRPDLSRHPQPRPSLETRLRRAPGDLSMLGTLDTNPNHPALDKSCMGEAQGPYRYARGHSYFATMQARDAGTPNHTLRTTCRASGMTGTRCSPPPAALARAVRHCRAADDALGLLPPAPGCHPRVVNNAETAVKRRTLLGTAAATIGRILSAPHLIARAQGAQAAALHPAGRPRHAGPALEHRLRHPQPWLHGVRHAVWRG